MRVELHVETLVLEGFPDSDGPAIAAAVQERLGTLLATDPVHWHDHSYVDAGAVDMSGVPSEAGARLATAVHQGLSR